MEVISLFGAGEKESVMQIMEDIVSMGWQNTSINAVYCNNSDCWGDCVFGEMKIQRPSNIVTNNFDRLVVCANRALCQMIIPVLIEKFKLKTEQVIPYYEWMRFNVGNHQINWKNVNNRIGLTVELQNCDNLNVCEEFFYHKQHRFVEKYAHYFEIYDRHFQKYRNTECVVAEIGVFKGGSLQIWKDYFGKNAQIIGIDIEESVINYAEEQIVIEIGSQSDRGFWKYFKEKYPRIDILIDDGGHTMEQQIVTFEEMFDHIAEDGVYLCEDLHTSYWERYGGGYKNPDSFIEYSKEFIDYINAWYNKNIYENKYTRSMHSLHYYDSVLVIEKRKMYKSVCMCIGQ